MRYTQGLGVVLLLALIAGCAQVPQDVRGDVTSSVSLAAVRADESLAQGQLVRWGGLVARVQNKEGQTWIEIVEKPLGASGRPIGGNVTNGRFIAVFDRFLEPMMFQAGREITIMGAVQPAIEGKIDEQTYRYVMVMASGHYLWEQRQDRHYDDVFLMHRTYWSPWWYTPVYIHHHHHRPPVVVVPPANGSSGLPHGVTPPPRDPKTYRQPQTPVKEYKDRDSTEKNYRAPREREVEKKREKF